MHHAAGTYVCGFLREEAVGFPAGPSAQESPTQEGDEFGFSAVLHLIAEPLATHPRTR